MTILEVIAAKDLVINITSLALWGGDSDTGGVYWRWSYGP